MKSNYRNWFFIMPLLTCFMLNQAHTAAFSLPDAELQTCLQKLAEAHQWQRPQDVTAIKCHNKSIRSLQGLEQFINLESLSLYNNKLAKIDIDFTVLKKLTSLNLARNNLTHITISHLPSLNKIYLFDNGTKTLNLTHLINLEVFKANNNNIETFNYFNIPKLKKMYIFNNKLADINIYDLPSLQYMDCRQNPMPDSLYDEMDKQNHATFLHDGNADDW